MAPLRWTLMLAALLLVAVGPAAAGWSPLGGPAVPLAELQLDRGRPDLLYVNADNHLWRSDDAGATWRSLQAGLGRAVTTFALDPANRGTIWAWTSDYQLWRSRDGGETWSQRATAPSEFPWVVQLLVDSVDPETLYRIDESLIPDEDFKLGLQVWVSRDGGASFRAGAFLPNDSLFSISTPGERKRFFVHPERSELLFFGNQGVLTSRDGGQTWSPPVLFHGAGFDFGRPAPSHPDTLYGILATSGCPVRSDDAGVHWLPLACPSLRGFSYSYGFSDLAVDPQSASHVWLVDDVDRRGFQHFLFESNDGGESWSPPSLMPQGAVVPAGGSIVYTGSSYYNEETEPERGLSASRDGGRTWRSLAAGISAGYLSSAFVMQRSPGAGDGWRFVALVIFEGRDSGLFLSKSGREWVKSGQRRFTELAATGGSTAVAVKVGRVVRSQDGGASWSAVPSAPKNAGGLLVDAVQPRYLAIHQFVPNQDYGDLVLWTSDDAGATWRQSSNGRFPCIPASEVSLCGFFSAYAVDPFDATHRYAAVQTLSGFVPPIYLSTDAGLSWHPAEPGIQAIGALAADPASPGRLLAETLTGLALSEDGGSHWRPWGDLPTGTAVRQLVRDERTATWYAATRGEGIYRSLDGWAHWTLLAGAPDLEYPTIAIDPRNPDALIATFLGLGVWQWRP